MKKIIISLIFLLLAISTGSAEELPVVDKNFEIVLSMVEHAGKFFVENGSLYLLEREQRAVVNLDGKLILTQDLHVLDYAIQKMRDKIKSLGPPWNAMKVDEVYYTYWGGGYALVRAIIP